MADVHSKEVRSYNMSRIKGKNTKPEMMVRKFLHGQGFRYRLHDKKLPGTPDVILPKYKTVILIHGCFWHGHKNCKHSALPKTRAEWWSNKIQLNSLRDKANIIKLRQLGWEVIVVWTCTLNTQRSQQVLKKLSTKLTDYK
jgi:DNA mismatch endonuclease, patch repair protein